MNLQHVNLKLFADPSSTIDLGAAIPIFHRWIQEPALDEMLIDVADYRHVPAGPGVLLIGHEANYSLDLTFNQLGLLYNRKAPLDGSVQDKLLKSFSAALLAASRLESESAFAGKLKFNAGRVEVILNDRLLTPNTDATWSALATEFDHFFRGLFGEGHYTMTRVGEPRERLRVTVDTHQPIDTAALLPHFAAA